MARSVCRPGGEKAGGLFALLPAPGWSSLSIARWRPHPPCRERNPMITHFLRIPGQLRLPLSLLGFLLGLWPLQPAVAAEGQPMVRVVCPVPVEGQTGCVLASRDKTG